MDTKRIQEARDAHTDYGGPLPVTKDEFRELLDLAEAGLNATKLMGLASSAKTETLHAYVMEERRQAEEKEWERQKAAMAKGDRAGVPDWQPPSLEALSAAYDAAVVACPANSHRKHLEGLEAVRRLMEKAPNMTAAAYHEGAAVNSDNLLAQTREQREKARDQLQEAKAQMSRYEENLRQNATEFQSIDAALGNAKVFDDCKTRTEKVLKAMAKAREADDLSWRYKQAEEGRVRIIREVETALDTAGAPHHDPGANEPIVRQWTFGERIAWLHTEKGLADARLTALQKVWKEKLDALTERATSAEGYRDEFQKRLEPLHGKPAWTQYSGAFLNDLKNLINYHSLENGSDTPDWILAEYLSQCLVNFGTTMRAREKWYGREIHQKTPEAPTEPERCPQCGAKNREDIYFQDANYATGAKGPPNKCKHPWHGWKDLQPGPGLSKAFDQEFISPEPFQMPPFPPEFKSCEHAPIKIHATKPTVPFSLLAIGQRFELNECTLIKTTETTARLGEIEPIHVASSTPVIPMGMA